MPYEKLTCPNAIPLMINFTCGLSLSWGITMLSFVSFYSLFVYFLISFNIFFVVVDQPMERLTDRVIAWSSHYLFRKSMFSPFSLLLLWLFVCLDNAQLTLKRNSFSFLRHTFMIWLGLEIEWKDEIWSSSTPTQRKKSKEKQERSNSMLKQQKWWNETAHSK